MPILRTTKAGHVYFRNRVRRVIFAGGGLAMSILLLAACVSEQSASNPLLQKYVWFKYLNGDDLRERCFEGSPTHYRLVYNARYQEQVRRYEVVSDGAGGATVISGAQRAVNLASFSFDDILAPKWWQRSEGRMSPEAFARFEAALQQSGFFEPAPRHLRLPSAGFYWTAVGCRGGRIAFNAWRHPSDRYEGLTFPPLLFAQDRNVMPINPPRTIDAAELTFQRSNPQFSHTTGTVFWLRVGENGLAGY